MITNAIFNFSLGIMDLKQNVSEYDAAGIYCFFEIVFRDRR